MILYCIGRTRMLKVAEWKVAFASIFFICRDIRRSTHARWHNYDSRIVKQVEWNCQKKRFLHEVSVALWTATVSPKRLCTSTTLKNLINNHLVKSDLSRELRVSVAFSGLLLNSLKTCFEYLSCSSTWQCCTLGGQCLEKVTTTTGISYRIT